MHRVHKHGAAYGPAKNGVLLRVIMYFPYCLHFHLSALSSSSSSSGFLEVFGLLFLLNTGNVEERKLSIFDSSLQYHSQIRALHYRFARPVHIRIMKLAITYLVNVAITFSLAPLFLACSTKLSSNKLEKIK